MSWFTTKAKPAPATVKSPVNGISKDKTRKIMRRIEAPISEKGKFYLKPLTCEQAWQFAERGGIYEMAANGVDDETVARRTGLSLFDVRRAIAGPWYRQVDVQEHRKGVPSRKLALLGWDENCLPDVSDGGHTYMPDEEIIRMTGLIPDPDNHFVLRWNHGGKVYMTAIRATGNPKSPDHNKLSVWWDWSVWPEYLKGLEGNPTAEGSKKLEKALRNAALHQEQVKKLAKRMGR